MRKVLEPKILTRILPRFESIFGKFPNKDISDFVETQARSKTGFKLLKLAVDNNNIQCDFIKAKLYNFECVIPLIHDIYLLQPYSFRWDEEVKDSSPQINDSFISIRLDLKNRFFSDIELKDMGYEKTSETSYREHYPYEYSVSNITIYEKIIHPDDLEMELLKYIDKLDSKVDKQLIEINEEKALKVVKSDSLLLKATKLRYHSLKQEKAGIEILKQYLEDELD